MQFETQKIAKLTKAPGKDIILSDLISTTVMDNGYAVTVLRCGKGEQEMPVIRMAEINSSAFVEMFLDVDLMFRLRTWLTTQLKEAGAE